MLQRIRIEIEKALLAPTGGTRSNGGIAVFRCFLMFLIVLHHCCCHSVYVSETVAYLFFPMTLFAVDGFVAISGWFSVRFSWMKVAAFVVLACGYGVVLSALSFWFVKLGWLPKPVLSWAAGWFTPCYLALMFFSPLINAGIKSLAEQSQKVLLGAWGLMSLAIVMNWTHLGWNVAGLGSHTFVTLLYVYVTLQVLRLCHVERCRVGKLWGILALCGVIQTICGVMIFCRGKDLLKIFNHYGYDAPWVLGTAVCVFLLFERWQAPRWLVRVCCFLGPSIYSVYLLHDGNLAASTLFIQKPSEWLHLHSVLPDWMTILLFACGVFCVTILIDLVVRRLPLWIIRRYLRAHP